MKYLVLIIIAVFLLAGMPYRTEVTHYKIKSRKIVGKLKIALISDLHDSAYGKNMERLIRMIEAEKADVLLMPGDMAENDTNINTFTFMNGISGKLPCFYSTGNHEENLKNNSEVKRMIAGAGVAVLDGNSLLVVINGNKLEIGGLQCRENENEYTAKEINSVFSYNCYRILLSHKPEWIDLYKQADCDLIVSGHAHGGQWRIPFFKTPMIAPAQGFLPEYVTGVNKIGKAELVICRGLVRNYHGIPRLYNNPEIVIIELEGEDESKSN